MIVFDLKCDGGHVFEAWFRSSDDFEEQKDGSAIACPLCGSHAITKAPMAANIGKKGGAGRGRTGEADSGVAMAEIPEEVRGAIRKIKSYVEKNCDYVGGDFAEEARKIHYGESKKRGIYGEADKAETESLHEEGIETIPLPFAGKAKPDA